MLAGTPVLARDISTLHTNLLGEEARLDSECKLHSKKKGGKKDKKDGKNKDKDHDDSELHECKHCRKMVKHKEKNCWDNPDNKDKRPTFLKQEPQANAAVTTSTSDAESKPKKKKKEKLVIAAAAVIDRDSFQKELDDAFRTTHEEELALHNMTDFIEPHTHTVPQEGYHPRTDGLVERSRSALIYGTIDGSTTMLTGPEVCDVCATIGLHTTETYEWAVAEDLICEICDSIGHHSTADHEFSVTMSKNKSKSTNNKRGKHLNRPQEKFKLARHTFNISNAPLAFQNLVQNDAVESDSDASVYEDALEHQGDAVTTT
jgi:hypothetical protein